MTLTYLVYLCAKAAADYGDPSFTFESFVTGQAGQDEDYSAYIEKCLPVVNEFIQRAYELNKLSTKIAPLVLDKDNGYILPDDLGKIISIFQYTKGGQDYQVVAYRRGVKVTDKDGKLHNTIIPISEFRRPMRAFPPIFTPNESQMRTEEENEWWKNTETETGDWLNPYTLFIQYRGRVPYFYPSSVINHAEADDGGGYYYDGGEYASLAEMQEAKDIDLEAEYGFSDTLATICVAFVQGRLLDDRSEGHSKEVEAESRLADVTLDETLYLQRRIVRSFR